MIADNPPNKRKKLAIHFAIACLVVGIFVLLVWFLLWRFEVYTSDAYVEGNQIYITSLRSGFVTAIHTDDTFLVQEGALLIELDTTDARIQLERSEQAYANAVRMVCQKFHQVFALRAEIEIKKAELLKVLQDFTHRADVLDIEAISKEEFEHATAALSTGFFALKQTESLYDKAYADVRGTSLHDHPQVKEAEDNLRDAWVQLWRCRIFSPAGGLAAQRKIQVGMWVEAGEPLMSVIALDQIWVNANFKETQAKNLRLGQAARLRSDLYGDAIFFHGTVVGLSGGAGNAFSILPPQNLSGNWIKIVQRLPVRICLDPKELQQYPLRLGLSMEVTVDISDQSGPRLPVTSSAAPLYTTCVYEKELEGVGACIWQIFLQNRDPELSHYTDMPLSLEKIEISKEFKEALLQTGVDPIAEHLCSIFCDMDIAL